MAKKKYTEDFLELDEIKIPTKNKDTIDATDIFAKLKGNKHFLVLGIVGMILIVLLIDFLHNEVRNSSVVNTSTNIVDTAEVVDAKPVQNDVTTKTENIVPNRTDLNENLIETLINHYDNDDIIIYLSILDKNEAISLEQPVAQSVNNTYYLDHNLNKKFDQNGSAFTDYNLTFETTPKNTVIYGNDAFEDSPFYKLNLFLNKEFFDNNKTIEIKLKNKTLNYTIFAFCKTEKSFTQEPISFSNNENFSYYLENIKKDAVFIDEANFPSIDDEIITLATSTNKANEDRFILYGKIKD